MSSGSRQKGAGASGTCQIANHNELLQNHRVPDNTGLVLFTFIPEVNDFVAYTVWLFGGLGKRPTGPYVSSGKATTPVLEGEFDHRSGQLQDNIANAGWTADLYKKRMNDLRVTFRRWPHGENIVSANLFDFYELINDIVDFRDKILPAAVAEADTSLDNYEKVRNIYSANKALEKMNDAVELAETHILEVAGSPDPRKPGSGSTRALPGAQPGRQPGKFQPIVDEILDCAKKAGILSSPTI